MRFRIVPGCGRKEEILALFTEYTGLPAETDGSFARYRDIRRCGDSPIERTYFFRPDPRDDTGEQAERL